MSRRSVLSLAALAVLACALPAGAQAGPDPQPPAPGPLRPFVMPPIHRFELPNGLKVMLVERHSLPLASARLIVDAGSAREPRDRAGVAVLTGNLLSEGTRTLTAAEFQQRMEALGAQFFSSATYDYAVVGVTALKDAFPAALELAMQPVTAPAFAPGDFERLRTRAVTQYVQSQSTVEGLRSLAFRRAVFQPGSPYALPAAGTRASLAGLAREDVARWHGAMFTPRNATLLLAGDLTEAEARRIATAAAGEWAGGTPAVSAAPALTARPQGTRVILVDRPGSVQSGIYVGQGALGIEDPDYVPLLGVSQVLGGGFGARINMNLRERHGWTYGAFTGVGINRGTGTFGITSSVRTNVTDSAVAETVREYRRIAAEAVPAQELREGMSNVVGSFPNTVQTIQGLVDRMQTVLVYGLPLDYYSTYRERLSALTPQMLADVARRRLTPDALTVVVAGDLSRVEAGVRALNLGPVEVWDADGNRVR
jgi:zinc protease